MRICFVAFVEAQDTGRCLEVLRNHPLGRQAQCIGLCAPQPEGLVTLKNTIGATRVLDMLSGEQLPRIC